MLFGQIVEKVLADLTGAISTFISKRAAGAKKIQQSAQKKGKYAILTAYHFAGKVKPYAEAAKLCKKESCEKDFKKKYEETLSKLKDIDSMSQIEFQKLSGVLEVWGEVYLFHKHPKDYSN